MNKFCTYCGTSLREDAVFCQSCGTRQPVLAASSAPVVLKNLILTMVPQNPLLQRYKRRRLPRL